MPASSSRRVTSMPQETLRDRGCQRLAPAVIFPHHRVQARRRDPAQAAIGYAQNAASRDDFLPWLGLVVGFGGGAAFLRWSERHLNTSIFVNVSGIGSVDHTGQRRIILWSELLAVRPRPWLTQVEFYGVGTTRRIVAPYFLERFPRLMELVSARLNGMQ